MGVTSAPMSPKRPASKQRRQSQNQRQRAALEARRANAAARPGPDVAGGGSGSKAASRGGSLLGRLRGAGTGGRAPRPTATAGSAGSGQPVGQRAAMSAMLAAAAAAVVGSFLIQLPVDRSGEPIATPGALVAEWSLSALDEVRADGEATAEAVADAVDDWLPGGTEPYAVAAWPLSLGVVLPVVGAGLAFRAVTKRAPAKVVNRTMYVTLFGTLLASQLLILFLPAVVGVGIAAFQVRKAEVVAQAEAAGDGPTTDDDVIEADEVDEAIEAEEAIEDDVILEVEDSQDDAGERT
jgi:hypothetical protein